MGEVLRHLIEKKLEWATQTALATEIGISQATIHKILYTDTIMTVPTLRKLARYFEVPLNRLLADTPGETIIAEEQTGYSSLSTEEEKLLHGYRLLCRAGKGDEVIQFVEFLVEREQGARRAGKNHGTGGPAAR